jgi:hypothetical protein
VRYLQRMRKLFFTLIVLFYSVTMVAQVVPFDQQVTDVGNIGLAISNVGTVGRPQVVSNPQGMPSMEYPLKSGVNHLFEGGLWIGAKVNGETRVSTVADDASTGYRAGLDGFEFTATGALKHRSKLASSEYYSSSAISHQDFIAVITDSNVIIPGTTTPIQQHKSPLRASVKMNTYTWNYSFADYFVIIDYEITNNSTDVWDSVWLGQWNDLVVRNLNITQDGGAAFYNKGGAGFIDSFGTIYVYEVLGDDIDFTHSYGACGILGAEWRMQFIHPANKDSLVAKGYPAPVINPNFWIFGFSSLNDFVPPADDVAKYARLRSGINLQDPSVAGQLNVGTNLIQLVSMGPFASMQPGETVNFTIAYTAAKQINGPKDNPEAREELMRNLNWVQRTYRGEDVDGKGVYKADLDLNGNGKLDRYVLPEPPHTPKVKIVPSANKVDIYWDARAINSIDPISKKKDFEGFKLYRSNPGDDKGNDLIGAANLVQQWDSAGNKIGYNNGFSSIQLAQPKYFEGDTTSYIFHYEMNGLLNGWQYMFILTAFDEGDDELGLEPLESSFTENDFRVFTGTGTAEITGSKDDKKIGVYPNPYKTQAAWDGNTTRTKKIYFYNLPALCTITIYNIAGDVITTLYHNAETYKGEDIRWYENYSDTESTVFSGGEHAWDMLSTTKNSITTGTYMFTVKDSKTGEVQVGKFVILK